MNAIKSHILISGTGRAGTTFLVRLLGELGEDTGFANAEQGIDPTSHAGLEVDLKSICLPKVIKSAWACDELAKILEKKSNRIEHCIVPIRDLFSAAESRRRISRISGCNQSSGGLWDTDRPAEQENVLAQKLYNLMQVITQYEIAFTVLEFPRLVNDSEYLWRNISPVFPKIRKSHFDSAFHDLVRPEWVHRFEKFSVVK